tara:strand:- start:2460 stop:2636 length:177 start_codon:yes stop_codon:yes gene_type:complete
MACSMSSSKKGNSQASNLGENNPDSEKDLGFSPEAPKEKKKAAPLGTARFNKLNKLNK